MPDMGKSLNCRDTAAQKLLPGCYSRCDQSGVIIATRVQPYPRTNRWYDRRAQPSIITDAAASHSSSITCPGIPGMHQSERLRAGFECRTIPCMPMRASACHCMRRRVPGDVEWRVGTRTARVRAMPGPNVRTATSHCDRSIRSTCLCTGHLRGRGVVYNQYIHDAEPSRTVFCRLPWKGHCT